MRSRMVFDAIAGFRRSRRANVAITFALAALPLITMVGAAIDYSSAANINSELQADADATALIACRSTLTAQADLKALAQSTLNGYLPKYTVNIDTFTSTNNPRSVDLVARVVYPTKFMKVANIRSMTISAESKCAAGENFFEIALVLDTTGSMNNSAGSTTKIEALKTAATNFVNTMFTNFDSSHVKVSIVPFAASVKVDPTTFAPSGTPSAAWLDTTGTSSVHWSNVTGASAAGFSSRFDIFKKLAATNSSWAWAGCLESLPYPYNTKDTAPSSSVADTRYVPLFAPDEIGTEFTILNFPLYYDPQNSSLFNNSYIDDGTSTSGSCYGVGSNNYATRMGQACKYVSPKYPRTSEPGPNWGCTSRPLTRLTNIQTALTTEISKLTADGKTNINEGLHWGWRTISSTGVFTDASAYGAANTTKIIVLMTDGVNTWNADSSASVTGSEYSAYGYFTNADGSKTTARLPSGYGNLSSSSDARNAIDQLTRETCTNAKAKNVAIYTVAFSVSGDQMDTQGQTLLQACASSTDKFFLATNASSLNDSFVAIAKGIGALRIVR